MTQIIMSKCLPREDSQKVTIVPIRSSISKRITAVFVRESRVFKALDKTRFFFPKYRVITIMFKGVLIMS